VSTTVTLSVPGMSCGHCEAAVKSEVGKVAGVASVSVDLDSKDVVVTGDPLDVDAIIAAVDAAGYEASVVAGIQ
jgi:copper ion binding protein